MNETGYVQDIPHTINSTAEFIKSANDWNVVSFTVNFSIVFTILVLVIMYFVARAVSKYTTLTIDAQKDSTIAITNNTNVSGKILDLLKENESLIKMSLDSSKSTENKASMNSEKMDKMLHNTEKIIDMLERNRGIIVER